MKNVKNLHRCIAFLFTAFLFGIAPALADTVKGTVVDDTGEPLTGATVVLKGQKAVGTSTNIDGRYSINVPDSKKAVLVFSFIGMHPREEKVNGRSTVDVVLESNTAQLDEVVVVGYGQQKKVSVVGAITQTTGEVLERTGGVSSVGAALTGNLPGVTTMATNGRPGDEDPEIVIRGVSSWNGSDPLILVDGIERPMSSVDIGSVKSVSVLKDASATAVYGVKGANGVILITTKRGQEGRANISVGMNVTAKVVSQLPKKYDSYGALYIRNRAIERELGLRPDSWTKILAAEILDKYRNPANLEERERYPNVDWEDEMFKHHAMSYNPNVNISGGTKNVKYFASIDYLHEGDIFKEWDNGHGYTGGYGFDRVNVRSNLDFQITPSTLLKVNLSGSHGQRKGPFATEMNSWFETQLWQAAYSAPSDVFLPRYSDGSWGYYPTDTQGAPNSVIGLAKAGQGKFTTTRINTDFTLEQDLSFITKGLKASALVSWDNVFVENKRGISDDTAVQYKWIDPDTGEVQYDQKSNSYNNFDFVADLKLNTHGGEVDNNATQRNMFYQFQLQYARQFGLHDVTAMAVFNRTERAWGSQFTNYREDWAFRATYNFADKYFAEFNGAYNGSEKFSKDHRFEFFPSGALGWMISQENFMKFSRGWLDMLKVRYSLGKVGDDNVGGRWLYENQWAYGGVMNLSVTPERNRSPYEFYYMSVLGNPNIHWETATKQNIGIDFGFLNNFLAGTVEIFNEERKDILVAGGSRAIPSFFGTSAPYLNMGRVDSKGYEIELRINKTVGNGVHLWANLNMTHAENKIKTFDDPQLKPAYQKQTGFAIGQDHVIYDNGFANTWDDVIAMTKHNTNDDQKLPGQYFAVDYNGDGVIDSNDSTPYGYTGTPQNNFNATLGVDWKGWSLYVQFYGVTNVQRTVVFNSLGGKLNTVFDEGSYWSASNKNADAPLPRWLSTPAFNTGWDNIHNHYDGSYVRLKNAEIAYTWNKGWVRSLGLSSLRVYLNGNNLLTWHHMPDDRESNHSGTGNASQGAYPTVRRFNLGFRFEL